MKNVMIVIGTRPEAIKMAPVYHELRSRSTLKTTLVVTAQHREMLDQVLMALSLIPDADLDIMKSRQTINDIISAVLEKMPTVFDTFKPDILLVHGDTATTLASSLAAFHAGVTVAHVEAGLRSWDKAAPFPEEIHRQMVDDIADVYFAPTELSRANLLKEGKPEAAIHITGNTAIDALKLTVREDYTSPDLDWAAGSRLILLTAHRRENQGAPMLSVFRAIQRIIDDFPDIKVIYPVHLNPVVREAVNAVFGSGNNRVRLIEPLDVIDFHNFLRRSYIVLTDSGGIQEEAPSLNVPVLVTRDVTERPEGITAGTLKLIGTNEENVYSAISELLTNSELRKKMADAPNPYGDGLASVRIADILEAS
jgi:UDP-N-acetylglucosamine 2-epimerase (non-hydrolysing)